MTIEHPNDTDGPLRVLLSPSTIQHPATPDWLPDLTSIGGPEVEWFYPSALAEADLSTGFGARDLPFNAPDLLESNNVRPYAVPAELRDEFASIAAAFDARRRYSPSRAELDFTQWVFLRTQSAVIARFILRLRDLAGSDVATVMRQYWPPIRKDHHAFQVNHALVRILGFMKDRPVGRYLAVSGTAFEGLRRLLADSPAVPDTDMILSGLAVVESAQLAFEVVDP